jgi:uncharacterized protein (DUF2141 family)
MIPGHPTRLAAALAGLALGGLAVTAPAAALADECGGGPPTGVKVNIRIENVHASQGIMTLTMYGSDPHKFLAKGGSLKVERDAARAPAQTMCWWAPGPGTYAAVVYQDLDSNKKFNYNLFTGPKEPWGLTRNPKNLTLLHRPTLDDVKVDVHQGDNTFVIRLNDPK